MDNLHDVCHFASNAAKPIWKIFARNIKFMQSYQDNLKFGKRRTAV